MATTATAVPTIADVLLRQDQVLLERKYKVLGKVWLIECAGKNGPLRMNFRKEGPGIALVDDSDELVLLSRWRDLPPLAADSTPCKDCLADCRDCQGKGRKKCTLPGCGGQGFTETLKTRCDGPNCAIEAGKYNPKCEKCKGYGEMPIRTKCKGCDDDGMAECGNCRVTGKMNTGRKDGSTDDTAPRCRTCNGNLRVVATVDQNIKPFVQGRLPVQFPGQEAKEMLALGPIQKIIWESERGQGYATVEQDDGGNLMVLLVEGGAGSKQYLLGGVPRIGVL